jgi:hypothetical protein
MDEGARLRLEYDQAVQLLRSLTEIRFRLLALVPTLSGAVVALVSAGQPGVELLAIGGLGLSATTGVLVYELRNGELRRQAAALVRRLERVLLPHGPLVGAGRKPRLFGVVGVSHELGLGLVYGAALGGWSYLVAWGALKGAGMHAHARSVGLVIGAVAGAAVVAEVLRIQRPDERDEGAASTEAPPRAATD